MKYKEKYLQMQTAYKEQSKSYSALLEETVKSYEKRFLAISISFLLVFYVILSVALFCIRGYVCQ